MLRTSAQDDKKRQDLAEEINEHVNSTLWEALIQIPIQLSSQLFNIKLLQLIMCEMAVEAYLDMHNESISSLLSSSGAREIFANSVYLKYLLPEGYYIREKDQKIDLLALANEVVNKKPTYFSMAQSIADALKLTRESLSIDKNYERIAYVYYKIIENKMKRSGTSMEELIQSEAAMQNWNDKLLLRIQAYHKQNHATLRLTYGIQEILLAFYLSGKLPNQKDNTAAVMSRNSTLMAHHSLGSLDSLRRSKTNLRTSNSSLEVAPPLPPDHHCVMPFNERESIVVEMHTKFRQ